MYTVVLVLEADYGVVMSVSFVEAADAEAAGIDAYERMGDATLSLLDALVFEGRQEDVLGVPVEALRRMTQP